MQVFQGDYSKFSGDSLERIFHIGLSWQTVQTEILQRESFTQRYPGKRYKQRFFKENLSHSVILANGTNRDSLERIFHIALSWQTVQTEILQRESFTQLYPGKRCKHRFFRENISQSVILENSTNRDSLERIIHKALSWQRVQTEILQRESFTECFPGKWYKHRFFRVNLSQSVILANSTKRFLFSLRLISYWRFSSCILL